MPAITAPRSVRYAALTLAATAALALAAAEPVGAAHPVRVNKSDDGWPHFFEVWDGNTYQPRVLKGYGNIWFGREKSKLIRKLDDFQNHNCDFIRMWIRPSDGFYAYAYDAGRKKVDLDRWNEDFFKRLDWILDQAQSRRIVVEVMLWDRCTGWRGGGLAKPTTWEDWKDGKNVHHPDNHYRSSAGNKPIPGLHSGDESRINNKQWYDVGNRTWMNYQKAYMQRVIEIVMDHEYASIELVNEAPGGSHVVAWRKHMHDWMHSKWPELMTSGEGLGDDDEMRQWAANNPDHLDLVPTHKGNWSYGMAHDYYHKYKGVLPGINENISRNYKDLNSLRREAWGVTMGGGAVYNENYPDGNGRTVCLELHAFFYPDRDRPAFWKMRPHKDRVKGNRGHHYVLATDDGSEFLVFVDNEAGTKPFDVDGSGAYRYRWFTADGGKSSWSKWTDGDSWSFTPPGTNRGLQIRKR
jgi:hypothetical protein